MKTFELEHILGRQDPCTKKSFLGVFPSDLIPPPRRCIEFMVCNLDGHLFQGSHWVCVYLEKGDGGYYKGEYYDSFGRGPNHRIKRYLDKYCKSWTQNNVSVQNFLAKTCGHHVIYYLTKRCRGLNMNEIVTFLKYKTCNPDYYVFNFVQRNFKN
jgi:hypothetical protein